MPKERAPKSSRPQGYLLTNEAHASLIRARDHLNLLARITATRIAYDAHELELSQDTLVHSFGRLAMDLDEVVQAARCQR